MIITTDILTKYFDVAIVIFSTSLGIGFSVFTLFYSFIANKKDFLKEIKEEIINVGESVSMLRKRNNAIGFINSMKKINSITIILIIISFVSLMYSITLKLLLDTLSEDIYCLLLLSIIILALIIFGILILIFIKMILKYNRTLKI